MDIISGIIHTATNAVESVVNVATTTAATTLGAVTSVTEEAIEAAADAAAKVATELVSAETSVVGSLASSVLQGVNKLSTVTSEYFRVDDAFKTATTNIHKVEGNSPRVQRLQKNMRILEEMEKTMVSISKWLEHHTKDTVTLEGICVSVDSVVLGKFMTPLAAGLGNLKRLANDVRKLNGQNQRITDPQIDAMERCLAKVNSTFESIVMFIKEKKKTVTVLSTFPLSEAEVMGWK